MKRGLHREFGDVTNIAAGNVKEIDTCLVFFAESSCQMSPLRIIASCVIAFNCGSRLATASLASCAACAAMACQARVGEVFEKGDKEITCATTTFDPYRFAVDSTKGNAAFDCREKSVE